MEGLSPFSNYARLYNNVEYHPNSSSDTERPFTIDPSDSEKTTNKSSFPHFNTFSFVRNSDSIPRLPFSILSQRSDIQRKRSNTLLTARPIAPNHMTTCDLTNSETVAQCDQASTSSKRTATFDITKAEAVAQGNPIISKLPPSPIKKQGQEQSTKDLDTHGKTIHSSNLSTKKKYKPVALKVRPVLNELPDKFRIIRNIIGDPLRDLPTLNPNPPPFTPCGRYTLE